MDRQINRGPWPYESIRETDRFPRGVKVAQVPIPEPLITLPMLPAAAEKQECPFFASSVLIIDPELDQTTVGREFALHAPKSGSEFLVKEGERFVVQIQNKSTSERCRVIVKRRILESGISGEGKNSHALADRIVELRPLQSKLMDAEYFANAQVSDGSFSMRQEIPLPSRSMVFEFLVRYYEEAIPLQETSEAKGWLSSLVGTLASLKFMCSLGFPPIESFASTQNAGSTGSMTVCNNAAAMEQKAGSDAYLVSLTVRCDGGKRLRPAKMEPADHPVVIFNPAPSTADSPIRRGNPYGSLTKDTYNEWMSNYIQADTTRLPRREPPQEACRRVPIEALTSNELMTAVRERESQMKKVREIWDAKGHNPSQTRPTAAVQGVPPTGAVLAPEPSIAPATSWLDAAVHHDVKMDKSPPNLKPPAPEAPRDDDLDIDAVMRDASKPLLSQPLDIKK